MKRALTGAHRALRRRATSGWTWFDAPLTLHVSAHRLTLRHRDGRSASADPRDHEGSRARALAAAFRALPGEPPPRVRVALPQTAVERHHLQLPWKARLREEHAVLRLKVRHELPRHARAWSYRITHRRRGAGEHAEHQFAWLNAVPAQIIDDLGALFREAGLQLAAIHPPDLPECDFLNAPRIGADGRIGLPRWKRPAAVGGGGAAVLVGVLVAQQTLFATPEPAPAEPAHSEWTGTGHRAERPAPAPRPPSHRAELRTLLDAVPETITLDRVRMGPDGALRVEGFALGAAAVQHYRERLAGISPDGLPAWRTASIQQARPQLDRYGRPVVTFSLRRPGDPTRAAHGTPGPGGDPAPATPRVLEHVARAGLDLLAAESSPLIRAVSTQGGSASRLSVRTEGSLAQAWRLLEALPERAPQSLTLTVRGGRLRLQVELLPEVTS